MDINTVMKHRLRTILTIFLLLLIGGVAYLEIEHKWNYGHFVGYALHVDSISHDVYIGIPGQTKLYSALISNFTLLPVKFEGCSFITDAFGKGVEYAYSVQRWDNNKNEWLTIANNDDAGICQPTPLSKMEATLITGRIWPGSTVDIMANEATGARDSFAKGDIARFVVFQNFTRDNSSAIGIPSEPFTIVDDVVKNDSESSPIKH